LERCSDNLPTKSIRCVNNEIFIFVQKILAERIVITSQKLQ